ncbi:MAG: amidohydrolase family protein [Gemmatimonadales bacterium]
MKHIRHMLAAVFLIPALGQAQSQPITLIVDRVLDGAGGILEHTNIVVRGSKIEDIGSTSAGVKYDLSGLTVLPGGIDTHNHVAWHFDADGKTHHASRDEESPSQATLYAVENAYKTLMSGITTIQSLGSPLDRDLRDWIARGTIPGPRIVTSLGAITERTGTPDDIREAVAKFAEQGADVIKIFASASIRNGGKPTMSQAQLDAACGEARKHGLRSAVHAHGPESAKRSILAGCTVIEHGALLDDATLDLMAERGTYFDPHIWLVFHNYLENKEHFLGIGNYTEEGFAYMERALPSSLDVFKRALARNINIVFGTDAVAGAHGRNFEELIYRVQRGGQDPMEAIVSATSLAARSMDMDDEIGLIAPGMAADIIAVRGNPATNITALRRVEFVMKGGKVFLAPHK